jgi:ABC-type dipeptide/oligopeptide/nickel transport system ATPase component
MVESVEANQVFQSSENSVNKTTEAFLEEIANDHARFWKVNSSEQGFPCEIYKTKSDCDWHPPCHWTAACD